MHTIIQAVIQKTEPGLTQKAKRYAKSTTKLQSTRSIPRQSTLGTQSIHKQANSKNPQTHEGKDHTHESVRVTRDSELTEMHRDTL